MNDNPPAPLASWRELEILNILKCPPGGPGSQHTGDKVVPGQTIGPDCLATSLHLDLVSSREMR